ncbi:MAG: TonB-dependent receptor [Bacteroidales bacterium]|nr:TonB-dependent receptor [Bacteroidales bacterium]
MKRFVLGFFLTFLFLPAFSAVTVTGRVIDASNRQPIEFVIVSIVNPSTQKTVGGALTDEFGVFNISNIQRGDYELSISFVGYVSYSDKLKVQDVELSLGDILLKENAQELKEVQIIGQGMQMRFDIDKKVFSVDQNIASAGGSATDVLQNIPAIEVDSEGDISLRNNSSVEIWIDGKPSGLTADNRAQILQQMPAENLESVEVMTNPSAKFNPEGTAGIINLVMKKNRKSGYYGSVSAGATLSNGKPGYNAGASINYNVGKFDVYANIGYRQRRRFGKGFTDRLNYNNGDTTQLTQNSTNTFNMGGVFFRAGVDYRINDRNSIGIGGMGHMGTPTIDTETDYLLMHKASNTKLRDYYRLNKGSHKHQGSNFNLYHKIDFDDKGSNLMTNLIYSTHSNLSTQHYQHIDKLISDNEQDIKQQADGNNGRFEAKSDFTWKFTDNNRMELGWSSRWNERLSEADAYDFIRNKPIEAYYNKFDYDEQIHALYGTYGTRINNFSAQAGLRGEYFFSRSTTTPAPSENSKQPVENKYFQLFPSVYLAYSLPNNNEIQLNYTRRIDRPRGRMINSFRDYSDSTNISYGNPALKPEITSAFELNYIKNWDDHTLSSSLYYRFNNDDIERVSFIRNGQMESTFMNLTKEHDFGVELISRNKLFKILNLTSTLNMYYNKLDGSVYENPLYPDVRVELPELTSFSWDARMIANLMFSPTLSGQITGRYRSAELLAQGERHARYSMDAGLRKTFFDKRLSLNFNIRDIFNTRGFKGTTWGDGFYQYSERQRRGRMFGLTLTYSFGNMRPKKIERPSSLEGMDNGAGEIDMD